MRRFASRSLEGSCKMEVGQIGEMRQIGNRDIFVKAIGKILGNPPKLPTGKLSFAIGSLRGMIVDPHQRSRNL